MRLCIFGPLLLLLGASGCPAPAEHDLSPLKPITSAQWIGLPDDPLTTVVFTFSNPIPCSALQQPAWETRIDAETQVLEMMMIGTTPGTFKITEQPIPATGDAVASRLLTKPPGEALEGLATGGTVTLVELSAHDRARGSFAFEVDGVPLSGEFTATFCPGGREP
jgi:hypothetical protein